MTKENYKNYLRLKALISNDEILLLPHKKYRGFLKILLYARCGLSYKYFNKAYKTGKVILEINENGMRVGYPIHWDEFLKDYLNNNLPINK